MIKHTAIIGTIAMGGLYMLYENDYRFQEQVNKIMIVSGYVLIACIIVAGIYFILKYMMPELNNALDRAQERKLKNRFIYADQNGLAPLDMRYFDDERTQQAILYALVQKHIENPQVIG